MPGPAHHRAQAVQLCRACASTMQGQLGFTAPQSSQTCTSLPAMLWSQVGHEATRPDWGSVERNDVSMLLKISYIIQISATIQDLLTHSPGGRKY